MGGCAWVWVGVTGCGKAPKTFKHPEVTGYCDPSKLHLPQSQVSMRAVKTFHYKVVSKLYCNSELNFLVNFNLILSALKRS